MRRTTTRTATSGCGRSRRTSSVASSQDENAADEKWYAMEVDVRGGVRSERAARGGGRPYGRFLLFKAGPLHDTHVLGSSLSPRESGLGRGRRSTSRQRKPRGVASAKRLL